MSKTISPSIWQDGPNTCICVCVRPNSSKDSIHIDHNSRIEITIKAKPEAGKANIKMLEYLSKTLDLPEAMFTIRQGHSSRKKVIVIKDSDATLVKRKLGLIDDV